MRLVLLVLSALVLSACASAPAWESDDQARQHAFNVWWSK